MIVKPRAVRQYRALAAAALLLTGCSAALPGRVTARVVTLAIPTYAIGPTDPSPRLFEDEGIYPYAMQDDVGRAGKATSKTYRAVLLENQYTRVIVMPELGGKIYAAADKTNGGADFIYHNHVVKPALVALRGAWVSGGVEWNFPSFGHTTNTFEALPFVIEHHADGSASVVVGTTEWARRMRWTVRITLRPDRSYIKHTARLSNPTPYHRRAYYWVNGAVHARAATRVVLPTNVFFFGERQDPKAWPGNKPDRSYYARIAEPTDHFSAVPSHFIAAYHEDLDRGTAHFADKRQSAGKKFFTWGTAREGAMWEPLLTDGDGKYIELQSGRLLSQHDTWIFEPQSVETVTGYWYALRGIGGVDRLNAEAAIRVERVRGDERRFRVGINSTAHRRGAELLVLAGARVVRREQLEVGPALPWRRQLVLPADVTGAAALRQVGLRFVLRSADGRVLISRGLGAMRPRYPRAQVRPKLDAKADDAQTLFLRGRRALLEWRRGAALALLRRAADKGSVRAHRLLGEQLLVIGRPQAALLHLDAALARDEHDPRARSYRALARLSLAGAGSGGAAARADLAAAAARTASRRVAQLAAGCEAMSRGRHDDGLSMLARAARASDEHTARVLLAAARRVLGKRRGQTRLIERVLHDDPLHPLALIERALSAGPRSASPWQLVQARLAGDTQLYLEAALRYAGCGMLASARAVLRRARPRATTARAQARARAARPLLLLHAADIARRLGRDASATRLLADALRASPRGVFPFRRETRQAIERALRRSALLDKPTRALRWKLHYYLGTLHVARGRLAQARAELARAAKWRPAFATLYRTQAAIARKGKDRARAAKLLERAISHDRADFRLYVELDQIYDALGMHDARAKLLGAAPPAVQKNPSVLLRRALLATQRGRHDEALAILTRHRFPPWEGWTGGRDVYLLALHGKAHALAIAKRYGEALAALSKALRFPENLGSGRPAKPDLAREHFYIGKASSKLGRSADARAAWLRAAAKGSLTSASVVYRALALRELGRRAEATALLGKARAALGKQLSLRDKYTHRRHYAYALVSRALGDIAGARAAVAKALARRPDYEWARRLQRLINQPGR